MVERKWKNATAAKSALPFKSKEPNCVGIIFILNFLEEKKNMNVIKMKQHKVFLFLAANASESYPD